MRRRPEAPGAACSCRPRPTCKCRLHPFLHSFFLSTSVCFCTSVCGAHTACRQRLGGRELHRLFSKRILAHTLIMLHHVQLAAVISWTPLNPPGRQGVFFLPDEKTEAQPWPKLLEEATVVSATENLVSRCAEAEKPHAQ